MSACSRAFTALALVVAFVAVTLHAQVPATQITITGRVVAEATDAPVYRVDVIAFGTTTRTMSITSTDADGQFQFPALPEDRYRLGVSRPPYVSAIADASASPTLFRLTQGAVISGQVVTALNQPQRGVSVVAQTSAGVEAGRSLTDPQGLFRIHGLAAGDYLVAADGGAPTAITLTVGEDRPSVHFTLPPKQQEPPLQTRSGVGRIAGRVLSTVTGRPLVGVSVLLTGGATAASDTESTGAFEFTRLPAGTYTLRLGQGAMLPQGSVVVDVADTPVTDIVMRGRGFGRISGVVRDDRGGPIAGIPVSAYLRSQMTEIPFLLKGAGAQTDERGAYVIDELAPGAYLICACDGRLPRLDPAMLRQLIRQSPQPAQLLPFMAASAAFTPATFYPGQARATDALSVSLTEGDHYLGIDITIPISATHTVFGRLVPQGQVGIEGTTVRLVLTGDVPEAIAFTEITPRRIAADGRFSIPGVPPGSYAIIAYPASRLGPTGMTLVTVEDRDISDVTVPLSPGGSVRGRVAFSPGSTPPSGGELEKGRISLNSLEGNLVLTRMADPSGRLNLQTSVHTDGTFELNDVPPGPYRLTAGGFALPWFSIESVTTSQGVANDHVVTITSGADTEVVLTMSAVLPAILEGSVHLTTDEGSRSLNIVLVASDWRARRSFFRGGAGFYARYLSADGTFRFPNIPAGDYFLVTASPSEFQLTEARLTQWERNATRVTLRSGETTRVTLKR